MTLTTTRKDEIFFSTPPPESIAVSDQDGKEQKDQGKEERKKSLLDGKIGKIAQLKKMLVEEWFIRESLGLIRHEVFRNQTFSKDLDTALRALGLKRSFLLNHLFSSREEAKNKYERFLHEAMQGKNEKLLDELLSVTIFSKRKICFSSSYLTNGCYVPALYPKEKILKR